jgi:uncharacterized protein YecE (DUF72 family)
MKFYIGTSGYGYQEWKGLFYPEKISAKKMLSFYADKFSSVEINNTFYRMPTINVVESWANQVPANFVFAIKAPQIITHVKRLKNVSEEIKYFLTIVSDLGKKLGAILFQFPASFHQDIPLLEKFIEHIPPRMKSVAFDFRGKSWHNKETYVLLKKRNFCLCYEDTDQKPLQEIVSTASWGYLRLRRADYTKRALSSWAKKIRAQNWQKVFVFFKHEGDASARGPVLAQSFRQMCEV